MSAKRSRADGELEAEVLACLWEAEPSPLSPAEVSERLSTQLAYTTVTTVLVRLAKKGLAQREHRGRGFVYSASLSASELASRRMSEAFDRVHDRTTTLSHFVGTLTHDEVEQLRRILDDRDEP